MADRGHVRTLDGDETAPARRSPVAAPAALAAVLVLGWLLAVGGDPDEADPVADIDEIREAGLSGEAADGERAVGVVRSFEAALNADDAEAAVAAIGADWVRLEIPGTSRGIVPTGDVAALTEIAEFAAAAADLRLGECSVSPSRLGAAADFAVVCPAPEVTGTYPDAIGRAGGGQPIVFGVADDRIVSILWSGYPGDRYDTTAYCEYAWKEAPAAAEQAFDADCRPLETPSALAFHRSLAALYVATGRPMPAAAVLENRYAVPTVERLFAAMEAGEPLTDYVDTRITLVRFPGMLLDPEVRGLPATADLLAWIGAVYDVDLGPCSTSPLAGGRVLVVCDQASWSGPLVTALGLGSVAQPIELLVDDFVVTNFAGGTAPELETAFGGMCDWIRAETPAQAEWAFEEGCAPDLTATGVTALLDAAARYAAAHALAPGVTPAGS